MSFQYQAGPRSSNRLISCRAKDTVLLNGGGSLSTGVDDDSGAVRSMTSTDALASASVRALSTDMGGSCPCGAAQVPTAKPRDMGHRVARGVAPRGQLCLGLSMF